MAETSGELFEQVQAASAKAKADYEKGLADAGDDEARKTEVTETYNRALGDATALAERFEAQRDAEEKEASHQRAAQITEREKLLESLSKPPTQRQVEETPDASRRSASYQAPGWQREYPAMLQSSDVLKRSGTDAAEEAEAQLQALDAWMSTTSEAEFENVYGPEVRSALGDIKAPPMDEETGDVLPGYGSHQRAAADFHVPYTAADGGVYVPDQIVPEVTSADVSGSLALINAVTRVGSATAKGHVATMANAAVSELSYGATLPVSNLGDDAGMVTFSCRRYYSQQDADNIMLRGPGYARTIRDTLLYAARLFISTEIADGQAASFTGLAALTSDVEWGDATVTIAQILNTEGALSEQRAAFPPDGLGWVMTKNTFYNNVLPLDITANKGSLITVGASPRQINGAPVYFTPTQTAAARFNNLGVASDGDRVAVFGNLRHYYVIEAGRPTVSRRPSTGFEEMATRFRAHFNAAGVRGRDVAFVMATSQ